MRHLEVGETRTSVQAGSFHKWPKDTGAALPSASRSPPPTPTCSAFLWARQAASVEVFVHLLTLGGGSRKPPAPPASLLGAPPSSDFPQTWLQEDLRAWATAHKSEMVDLGGTAAVHPRLGSKRGGAV